MINPFDTSELENLAPLKEEEDSLEPPLPSFSINSGSPVMNFEPPAPEPHMPTPQPSSEKRKFNIADLYWLRNLKPLYNQPLLQNECLALVISYNADFENLRLSFANPPDNSNRTVSIPAGDRKNAVNVFSETCRELIWFFETLNESVQFPVIIHNCERVITLSANPSWVPNETIFKITNRQTIEIHTKQSNGTLQCYTLAGWQFKAFLECCRFMVNGMSWTLKMHSTIHKDG